MGIFTPLYLGPFLSYLLQRLNTEKIACTKSLEWTSFSSSGLFQKEVIFPTAMLAQRQINSQTFFNLQELVRNEDDKHCCTGSF